MPILRAVRHVAVIIETSTQYGRNLIGGIAQFGQLHNWQLLFEYRGRNTAEPDWLEDFDGDGVITTCPSPTHSLTLAERGLPVIDISSSRPRSRQAEMLVDSDHRRVSELVADHLVAKGHRHFAFLGYSDHPVSSARETGFVEALRAHGFDCHTHHTPERRSRSFEMLHTGDTKFLESLPRPCGLFCCWDEVGYRVVQTARDLGIAVPEDLAVVAVDNDPVFCATAPVPLSSVDPDIPRMGLLTASWLQALMDGVRPDDAELERLVAPRGLVVRQSSALEAVEDPLVRKFLELLRQKDPGTLSIESLARACHVSRRLLEQRVKAATGLTPRKHLSQNLVEAIRRFLTQTDYTLAHIAEILGFEHSERLSHLFRRETGQTPGEYRKRWR